jgi:hypothetical protein
MDYVFRANIDHYNQLLAIETDARKIVTIRKLLAEEEAKLTDWQARNPRPNAAEWGVCAYLIRIKHLQRKAAALCFQNGVANHSNCAI